MKGTEKDYQIKSNEGDNLLETIKMAGIPIRCYFFLFYSFLATCNGNCVCSTCAVKFSPALHDQMMQSSKEAGLLRRKGKDGNGYKKQSYFYRAIQKYGWDSFTHEILLKTSVMNKHVKLRKFNSKIQHE